MDEKYLETAEALTSRAVDEAVARIRKNQHTKPDGFDGHCDCGDAIPEARIALGYYRCVACQTRLEKRR